MKKYSVLLSAVVAIAALVSCNKEIADPSNVKPAEGNVPFVLKADIPQTKLALADDWSLNWEDGDVIYAVTTDEEWGKAYTVDKDGETIAEFVCKDGDFTTEKTIIDGEHTFNFLYARADQKTYHHGLSTTYKLLADQDQDCSDPTANIKEYYPLAGQVTVTTPADDITADMAHLATIVKVTLKNKTEEDLEFTKFTLSMAGAKIQGVFTVNFGETPYLSEGSTYGSEVAVKLTNGTVAAGAELPVYVVLAPVTNYSGDITMTATDTEGGVYTKTNTVSGVTFAAGTYNTASFSINEVAATPVYTLTFAQLANEAPNNSYATAHEYTCDGINWNILGNQTVGEYLRVGGKNFTSEVRTLSSATAMPAIVNKVVVDHAGIKNGSNSTLTINSVSLNVYSSAAATTPIETVTINNPSVAAAGSLEFVSTSSEWQAGMFYQIAFDCKVVGNNNSFITVNDVKFFGEKADLIAPALESIAVSGQTTAFDQNSTWAFDGKVTATYADKSTKDVTESATFSGYDMTSTGEQTVTVSYTEGEVTKTTTYKITVNAAHQITGIVDVINQSFTGITGTSYAAFTGKTGASGAVYAGQCAGGNSSVQLRSKNSDCGIVTTSSDRTAMSVTVEWESHTMTGRTLNVYGSNTAYTSAADLYDTDNQGTLLGTIVCGTSSSLEIKGEYKYIGLCSNADAMYLTSISIEWSK